MTLPEVLGILMREVETEGPSLGLLLLSAECDQAGELSRMDEKETILTPEGLRKLEEELEFLKTVKRKEVAERIKQAKEFGDLSENSEYEDAKNDQAFTEGRILTLEGMLRNAKVINNHDVRSDVVSIGSTLKLQDESGEEWTFTIVGSPEADPAHDKISNESPVGRALLGKRKGETVTVQAPAGQVKYTIKGIRR